MELSEQMKKKIQRIVEDVTLSLAERIAAERKASAAPPPPPPPQPPASTTLKNPLLQKMLLELQEEGSR